MVVEWPFLILRHSSLLQDIFQSSEAETAMLIGIFRILNVEEIIN